jgi:octaprenyl-diphosphate synthase
MARVDEVIAQSLASGVPLVGQVSQYIIAAGGKRLRPALLLLLSRALGQDSPHSHLMAAVVEFIHTATLLHDDVVDESTLRRGRATANEAFGNAASVLVGDFLYSRAFQMMVRPGRMRVLEVLSEATNIIAEGEVMQLANMHDANLSEEAYLQVIRSKTAKLFEASARLAAILVDASPEIEEQCAAYGRHLGTAFQVIDDVLDYDANSQEMGKNVGDDLREGKTTLPLIVAMQRASTADKMLIVDAIEKGHTDQLETIVKLVRDLGAIEVTRQAAQREADLAAQAMTALPDNEFTRALIELALSLQTRRS